MYYNHSLYGKPNSLLNSRPFLSSFVLMNQPTKGHVKSESEESHISMTLCFLMNNNTYILPIGRH